jgi:gluconate 2-dehydrogenase gamma chain
MSETSRRELLRNIALGVMAGAVSLEAAQHVHNLAAADSVAGGAYKPKAFTEHEYATLEKLADWIVPSDDRSPGATEAGAPAFIDLLSSQNPELAAIYTGGIAWLDREMDRRYGHDFLSAQAGQQSAMLDLIAYRKNKTPELAPGIRFFDWARRMVVDAFYTSPMGVKDVGYMGNTAVAKFEVPPEVSDYVAKRSPV